MKPTEMPASRSHWGGGRQAGRQAGMAAVAVCQGEQGGHSSRAVACLVFRKDNQTLAASYMHSFFPSCERISKHAHAARINMTAYTTLHYTTLHYTTLHYTTLHYTTLHYTGLHQPPAAAAGLTSSHSLSL
jgi:hypothetical protein